MELYGSIPETFGCLDRLVSLDLSDNYLSGHIPLSIVLPPLQVFLIQNNPGFSSLPAGNTSLFKLLLNGKSLPKLPEDPGQISIHNTHGPLHDNHYYKAFLIAVAVGLLLMVCLTAAIWALIAIKRRNKASLERKYSSTSALEASGGKGSSMDNASAPRLLAGKSPRSTVSLPYQYDISSPEKGIIVDSTSADPDVRPQEYTYDNDAGYLDLTGTVTAESPEAESPAKAAIYALAVTGGRRGTLLAMTAGTGDNRNSVVDELPVATFDRERTTEEDYAPSGTPSMLLSPAGTGTRSSFISQERSSALGHRSVFYISSFYPDSYRTSYGTHASSRVIPGIDVGDNRSERHDKPTHIELERVVRYSVDRTSIWDRRSRATSSNGDDYGRVTLLRRSLSADGIAAVIDSRSSQRSSIRSAEDLRGLIAHARPRRAGSADDVEESDSRNHRLQRRNSFPGLEGSSNALQISGLDAYNAEVATYTAIWAKRLGKHKSFTGIPDNVSAERAAQAASSKSSSSNVSSWESLQPVSQFQIPPVEVDLEDVNPFASSRKIRRISCPRSTEKYLRKGDRAQAKSQVLAEGGWAEEAL
ncbi:hypothetical protein HDU96_005311 [Phlyctochytrium bullatum]|nr:hypothetical protein HDU96_005311 [Phlyctochytrium bullatum]